MLESISDSGATAVELGLRMVVLVMVIMMQGVTMMMTVMHLPIRSVSHGSRIEKFVTVEAGKASSVVDMLPACHL